MEKRQLHSFTCILLLLLTGLSACGRLLPRIPNSPTPDTPIPTTSPTSTAPPTETPTPIPPTPTPVPLAARVNGEGISLAEYQEELGRYLSAQQQAGTNLATNPNEAATQVLDDLINQVLLAQAAKEAGFSMDEPALQTRYDQLAGQAGGSQALEDWIRTHGYTPETFRTSLKRSVEAAWMRDQVISKVPDAADQVHARQILLYNSNEADQVYAQLQGGAKFDDVAWKYDPLTGGDLGWFPQGSLTDNALDEAAFALQPGSFSAVIHTRLGYHILEVIERDPQHPLDPNTRLALQQKALQSWLQNRRSQSQIEILVQ